MFEVAVAEKPLDVRIADALVGQLPSEVLDELYGEMTRALANSDEVARAARAKSVDPLCRDPGTERSRAADAEFASQRLRAAEPALRAKYWQTKNAEDKAAWQARVAPIEAKVDALVSEFRVTYTQAVTTLVDLLERAGAIDAEIRGMSVPAEVYGKVAPVWGVEQSLCGAVRPEFFKQIRLPMTPWAAPDAWPPKPRPVAYEYAACLPQAPPEVAGMTYEQRVARDRQIRAAEQQRLADYYQSIEKKRIENGRKAERREAAAAERQRNGL
jgi:hypothetical protein